jgi:hypothetical protein
MTFRQAKSRFRTLVAEQLKKRRWLIPAVTILIFVVTALFTLTGANRVLTLLAAIGLFAVAFLWGFSRRAFRSVRWPSTGHFPRQVLGDCWQRPTEEMHKLCVKARGTCG